jgi:hypothetical protein
MRNLYSFWNQVEASGWRRVAVNQVAVDARGSDRFPGLAWKLLAAEIPSMAAAGREE